MGIGVKEETSGMKCVKGMKMSFLQEIKTKKTHVIDTTLTGIIVVFRFKIPNENSSCVI